MYKYSVVYGLAPAWLQMIALNTILKWNYMYILHFQINVLSTYRYIQINYSIALVNLNASGRSFLSPHVQVPQEPLVESTRYKYCYLHYSCLAWLSLVTTVAL
jgi:hypothetical protein